MARHALDALPGEMRQYGFDDRWSTRWGRTRSLEVPNRKNLPLCCGVFKYCEQEAHKKGKLELALRGKLKDPYAW